MTQSVTLIHTVATLVAPFAALAKELLPGVEVSHVVDESLLTETRRLGRITPTTRRRLLVYATSADDLGVSAILVTCSSVGPIVDAIRPFTVAPVLRVDQAMADQAIRLGTRIGVLATLRSTLEPTRDLIETLAKERGVDITLRALVCEGAFDAIVSGDVERHDALVGDGLIDLATDSEVIVLAQASMARVLNGLGDRMPTIPVLSSPRLAIERLRQVLEGQAVNA